MSLELGKLSQEAVGALLSLNALPPIYVIPTHLSSDELHRIEDQIIDLGGPLTYDGTEAKIFLGRVEQKSRAAFDLRARGVWTKDMTPKEEEPSPKRRRLTDESSGLRIETNPDTLPALASESFGHISHLPLPVETNRLGTELAFVLPKLEDRVLVVKLTWLHDSLRASRLLPIEPFVVYHAQRISKPEGQQTPTSSPRSVPVQRTSSSHNITPGSSLLQPENPVLLRARADAERTEEKGHPVPYQHRRRFKRQSLAPVYGSPPSKLKRTTTSEFEESDSRLLPKPPDWVKNHGTYSCFRSTPLVPPNHRFIAELLKIRESRILTLDQIGVRAYSTSIASLSAYPHLLQSPLEIVRLPGCDERIASYFSDYKSTSDNEAERYLPAARKLDQDENLQCLKSLYSDIDDVVQFGWDGLTRAQQIGVKYYDEFKATIPRIEAETITEITKQHARKARSIQPRQWDSEDDIVAVIVGGYRRGKPQCGDVDIILTHRDPNVTHNLVIDVVAELETSGYITHTLTLNTTTTKRGQQTLPYNAAHGGHGFDSLDKALCVWQDPEFQSPTTTDPAEEPSIHKNPNIHRRVDIIISPWHTIGCAILGWSGGTTFERDLRRWCKRDRGWKFDSSGVRDRATGLVLDLESGAGEAGGRGPEADGWEERERRLMQRLGIGWRPATERCTG